MEKLIALLLFGIGVALISLFFIKLGWALFMVPVFGLREISYSEAWGLALLAAAFKPTSVKWKKD